jgi:adenylate kinase
LEIAVADEEIIRRLSGRRVHPGSGRTYHIAFNPPRQDNLDDETGEPLVQRKDDNKETVRNRLAVYHDQTKLLIGYYRQKAEEGLLKYSTVDGVGEVQEITAKILSALS